jgi:transcriptional regulator
MLVHPWDAPLHDSEWTSWLRDHDFGQLIAPGRGREFPVVTPSHFTFDGERTVWLHLARPNSALTALEEYPRALLTVVGDYVYIPSVWNANPGKPVVYGVPTSYYATVQLECDVRLVDAGEDTATILRRQLAHFEPGSGRVPVSATDDPDRRLLPGIRCAELTVTAVRAKFKYGGNKQPEHRERIAELLAARGGPMDAQAREHLLRRDREQREAQPR